MFSKKHTPFLTLFFLVLMVSSTYAQMEPTGNIAPLLTGRNVLAGSAHNDSPGSSDLTLIVQLKVDGNIVIDEGSSIKVIQPLQNIPSEQIQPGGLSPTLMIPVGKTALTVLGTVTVTTIPSSVMETMQRFTPERFSTLLIGLSSRR